MTAIDTNVIVALWERDATVSEVALAALNEALRRGRLVIAAPVFAELLAAPGRDEAFVDSFLLDAGIVVDWDLDEAIWREAGRAFRGYARRRKKEDGAKLPRWILADFVIGAHALRRDCRLLTLDARLYQAAFPELTIQRV